MEQIAPYRQRLLQLARDLLDGPIQMQTRSWEDGEFAIRLYHGYGPHPNRPDTAYHDALRYHSEDDDVERFLVAVDIATGDKTLINKRSVGPVGVIGAKSPTRKNREVAGGD